MNRPKPRARGFTLIELLLAISIFAIISISSYTLIDTVLKNQTASQESYQRFKTLAQSFHLLEQSLLQAVPRPIRDEYGDRQQAFSGDYQSLQFSHGGWANPMDEKRSDLRRSQFTFFTENLPGQGVKDYWRLDQWQVLDRAQDSQAEEIIRIGVKAVELRYMDEKRVWQSNWPVTDQEQSKAKLPQAVELTLDTEAYGEIKRIFLVRPQENLQSNERGAGDA